MGWPYNDSHICIFNFIEVAVTAAEPTFSIKAATEDA